jgi:hypothetical protein
MSLKTMLLAGVCMTIAAPARAQGCLSSQDAAVQCFVGNAVRTDLLTLHFGMTMSQFKAYGVAVSKTLQTQPTSLVVIGLASAVADAMPPTNASGSPNAIAQQTAMDSIVDAAFANNLVSLPAETSSQDIKWLSIDLVNAMNVNSHIPLSPGTLLRVIDSYIVSSTADGTVNWGQVNSSLASLVSHLASSGLLRLSPTITTPQAIQFSQSLAQTIYSYKVATGRPTL